MIARLGYTHFILEFPKKVIIMIIHLVIVREIFIFMIKNFRYVHDLFFDYIKVPNFLIFINFRISDHFLFNFTSQFFLFKKESMV